MKLDNTAYLLFPSFSFALKPKMSLPDVATGSEMRGSSFEEHPFCFETYDAVVLEIERKFVIKNAFQLLSGPSCRSSASVPG